LIIPTQQSDHNNNPQINILPSSLLRNRAAVLDSPKQPPASSHYPNAAKPQATSIEFYAPLPPPAPTAAPTAAHPHQQINNLNQLSASRIDLEVQVLNHCFDDIERFVSRLQASVETIHELEKRHQKYRNKSTKSKKSKMMNDEMQAARAQLPQAQSFVDIFQKFKLSFNFLARLKAHIHDPNAPELVHFLFNPLGLIMNAINKEIVWLLDAAAGIETENMAMTSATLKGLAKTVWLPMLNRDAKELLLNCLNSKEQELWVSFIFNLF